jgi:hypothetical protein
LNDFIADTRDVVADAVGMPRPSDAAPPDPNTPQSAIFVRGVQPVVCRVGRSP